MTKPMSPDSLLSKLKALRMQADRTADPLSYNIILDQLEAEIRRCWDVIEKLQKELGEIHFHWDQADARPGEHHD